MDGAIKGEIFLVSNAGHHLYIENPIESVADILVCTHSE